MNIVNLEIILLVLDNVFLVHQVWLPLVLVQQSALDVRVDTLQLWMDPLALHVLQVNILQMEKNVHFVLKEQSATQLDNAVVCNVFLVLNQMLQEQLANLVEQEQQDHWEFVLLVLLEVMLQDLDLWIALLVLVDMVQMELIALFVQKVNIPNQEEIVLFVQLEQSVIQLDNVNVLNVDLELKPTLH